MLRANAHSGSLPTAYKSPGKGYVSGHEVYRLREVGRALSFIISRQHAV